ncbi:MAG: hypothetical protein HYV95_04400 [Opitutae bacterium]|nr:hypothetical protein [Opitutae bacterium]
MEPIQSSILSWWRRSEVRLCLFGLSGVGAVYLGFLAIPVATAEEFVKRGGYYVMLAAFGLFLHALWQLRKTAPGESVPPLTRKQVWLVGTVIGLLSAVAIAAEPFQSKILNDEFVLQSTAFNMHFFRDVATMVRGYDIQGVFLSTDNYMDKRPYLYPFVVSLLHDLTGYRPLNAFLVNAGLYPLALFLAFQFGRLLTHWRGGLLAVLLLGSLPLLGQNATGSGMELLNVVMILVSLTLGTVYLRNPGDESFAAFLLAVVLLTQARYESALYVGAAALIGLLGWLRVQRVILPWQALLAPLLLAPCALQNKVVSHTPILWELTQQASTRFSLDYLSGNLAGAVDFLFNNTSELANSGLLSWAGLAGLLGLLVVVIRRRPAWRTASPAALSLAGFGLIILINTLLVFCYYWSNFSDRMASRLALPLCLLLTFCAVLFAAVWDVRGPVSRVLLVVVGAYAVGVSTTRFAHHYYSHVGIDEIEWTRRYVNSLPTGSGPSLIISNRSTLPWLIEKRPSILISRARLVADRLRYQLTDVNFSRIIVLQTLPPGSIEGDHAVIPEEQLLGFHLTLLAERRFGSKLVRISQLVSIDESALPPIPGPVPAAASTHPTHD